jgi:hypothetical protein
MYITLKASFIHVFQVRGAVYCHCWDVLYHTVVFSPISVPDALYLFSPLYICIPYAASQNLEIQNHVKVCTYLPVLFNPCSIASPFALVPSALSHILIYHVHPSIQLCIPYAVLTTIHVHYIQYISI